MSIYGLIEYLETKEKTTVKAIAQAFGWMTKNIEIVLLKLLLQKKLFKLFNSWEILQKPEFILRFTRDYGKRPNLDFGEICIKLIESRHLQVAINGN